MIQITFYSNDRKRCAPPLYFARHSFYRVFFFIFQKTEFLLFPPYQVEEYSFIFRDQYKIKKRLVYYINEIFKTSIWSYQSIFHRLFIRDTEINQMQDERFIGRCNAPFFYFSQLNILKAFFPVLKLPNTLM